MAATKAQDLVFNVTGQSFFFDCPEGRPSSVTSAEVFPWGASDDTTAETATTGSATVETNPNSTFDAASGKSSANPKLCNLAATTSIAVGRTYLATDAQGAKEWVDVVSVDSGNSCTARHPLQRDYVSADTFESTRISISVLDAWIQNKNKITDNASATPGAYWRIRWEYVVASVTYVHDSYADVVRYPGTHTVRPGDVDNASPGWLHRLPHDYMADNGSRLIDKAYHAVKMELRAECIADQLIRDQETLDHLVVLKTVEMTERARFYAGGGSFDIYDDARNTYSGEYLRLVKARLTIPIATDTGGAGVSVAPLPLLVR